MQDKKTIKSVKTGGAKGKKCPAGGKPTKIPGIFSDCGCGIKSR